MANKTHIQEWCCATLPLFRDITVLPMNARLLIDSREQGLIVCYSFIDFALTEQSYTLSSMADQEASVIVQSAAFRN